MGILLDDESFQRHVSNILSKLRLADRTLAAVYNWQKGVVHRK
jgi:DNA-binding NarL/FixJ family response regulator